MQTTSAIDKLLLSHTSMRISVEFVYPEINIPSASTIRRTVRRFETTLSLISNMNKIVQNDNVSI